MSDRRILLAVLALIVAAGAGCSQDSGGPLQCDYKNPATLASSAWPKFRHDLANTGNVTGVDLATSGYAVQWVFPARDMAPKGPFTASPVLNAAESLVYIGSSDNNLYAVNTADGTQYNIPVMAGGPITSTALAAERFGADAVFVGGGDGNLYGVDDTGATTPQVWPIAYGGFISASPSTNGVDGTMYVVALNGQFTGICPNGAVRFGGVIAPTQSTIAWGTGNVLYFGSNDRLLRAFTWRGVALWTFATSGPIVASPVADTVGNTVYAADLNGRVFRVNNSGQPAAGFTTLKVGGPVSGSPALAGGTLYVPSEDGTLYAVNAATGTIIWSLPTGGPLLSSPAVATSAAGNRVVVFAATAPASRVYIVADTGSAPMVLGVCTLGEGASCDAAAEAAGTAPSIESSPAIGSDGTIYIGAGDGRLYAIAPLPTRG